MKHSKFISHHRVEIIQSSPFIYYELDHDMELTIMLMGDNLILTLHSLWISPQLRLRLCS